jgi:hypothetical protein
MINIATININNIILILLTTYGLQSLASDEKSDDIKGLAAIVKETIDAWIYQIVEKVEYIDSSGKFKVSTNDRLEYDENAQKMDKENLAKLEQDLATLKETQKVSCFIEIDFFSLFLMFFIG